MVYKEIFLPDNAPNQFKYREILWNTVERIEKRKDAQLAREFTLSLPRELTIEQNKALLKEFITSEFVAQGMITDVCFHNDLMPDGERQPHAHVMLTLRAVNEEGFGQKVRAWNDKDNLLHWREAWANTANRHLALNGYDQQIDHRSYKEQGIELEPQHKIGATVAKEHLARLADHQRIARENGEVLFDRPEIALNALTRQQSTFTHQELARFVNRHTESTQQFQRVYEKVKSSAEIVYLGLDAQGRQRFSTQEMLHLESSMMKNAALLNSRLGHGVDEVQKREAVLERTLSSEQETAFHYLTAFGDLKSLVGFAGTGKSYLLGAAKDAWEASGYRVRGTALSGIAAHNLTDSSGIDSRTIASLFYRFDEGTDPLTPKDVLVVDEAGMLGSRTMERLVREVSEKGAKLVLVGDWQQLQAIEAGASFRAIAETHQYAELNHIRRQHVPWQVDASLDLALGHVDKALDAYREHDHVHTFKYQSEAKARLIDHWNDARLNNPLETQIILAYTRKDVQELNELARSQRRRDGELGKDVLVNCERGARYFAVNDRVSFLKRENSLSVINGTLGTICSIDAKTGVIGVELDAQDTQQKRRVVYVNTAYYNHLEHGYAATVYKAQGITVDRTYLLTSYHYDAHSTYVALTRHRQSCDVFVSREAFANDRQLNETLKRNRAKDVTLDYTNMKDEFARQRTIFTEKASLSQSRDKQEKQAELDIDALTSLLKGNEYKVFQAQLTTFEKEFKANNPELAKVVEDRLNSTHQPKIQALSREQKPQSPLSPQQIEPEKQKMRKHIIDREIDFDL